MAPITLLKLSGELELLLPTLHWDQVPWMSYQARLCWPSTGASSMPTIAGLVLVNSGAPSLDVPGLAGSVVGSVAMFHPLSDFRASQVLQQSNCLLRSVPGGSGIMHHGRQVTACSWQPEPHFRWYPGITGHLISLTTKLEITRHLVINTSVS